MNQETIDSISDQFTALYPKLLRYATSLARNKHFAHDLVMQVYLSVLDTFKEHNELPARLEFYLIRSIRNKFIDENRRLERFVPIDDCEGYLEPVEVSLPSDPFMKKRIDRAMLRLTDVCREILLLIAQGWTYTEIQRLTGRNRNSVASAVFNCRKNFRNNLYGNSDRRV